MTFKELYNSNAKKVGCYLTIGRRWVTVYDIDGECYTESLGIISKSELLKETKKVDDQRNEDARRKAWFMNKQLQSA